MKLFFQLKTKINRLALSLIGTGTSAELSEFEIRRVQVFNVMNLALVAFSGTFAVFQLLFYKDLSRGFLIIDTLNFPMGLLGLYLARQRQHVLARVVAIVGNLTIAVVLKLWFNDSGTELFALLCLLGAGFFLDNKILMAGLSLFCMICYLVLDQTTTPLPDEVVPLNVLHKCIGLLFIFIYLYAMKVIVSRFHIELSKQKELLAAKNNELHEMNQLKTRLFSIVSHDLRGPMSAFELYLKEFKQSNLEAEELQNISQDMLKDVEAINLLIRNLLQWSQNQLIEQRVKCERLDVGELIAGNCRLFELQASHKKITLQASLEQEYLLAYGDKDITNTIIRNLMSNAIKFSQAGTQVRIDATTTGEGIHISVTDHGTGMTSEQINCILEQKGHTTYGTHYEKGSGLGLVLTQQLLQKQGGRLTIVSTPEQGTTIGFDLPKYRRELIAV